MESQHRRANTPRRISAAPDGHTMHETAPRPRGSGESQILALMPESQIERIIEMCLRLETLGDVSELIRLTKVSERYNSGPGSNRIS
jgi:hypothetical protein